MLTAHRSLALSADSSPELPRIPELEALYRMGVKFRQGETFMVAGRPGSQKSGWALFLSVQWGLRGLRTLYCSADMSSYTASTRIAQMRLELTEEELKAIMFGGSDVAKAEVYESLRDVPITFSYGNPISWRGLDEELAAYIELWDCYPDLLVIDNLMDIEDCESDYTEQMKAMSELTSIQRETGMTILVLHHCSDKGATPPDLPPPRSEIKGGMGEKPNLTLTVAINPFDSAYRVAAVKQRSGPSDPSAQRYCTLQAHPEHTRFSVFRP